LRSPDVVLINGVGGEGTYEVDGDCLRGPLMVGTLCKGE